MTGSAGRFTTIDEVACGRDARVYTEGWQSWSPTTWYRLDEPARLPEDPVRAAMRFRAGALPPQTGFQGEGLLVLDPGDGEPVRCYGVDRTTAIPSIRAEVDGSTVRISTDGDPAGVKRVDAAGVAPALGRYGDRLARAAGVGELRPAPTAWCSWYRYFEDVAPADIEENLTAIEDRDLPVEVIQLDDGWEVGVGDWTENVRFGSLAPLADLIRSRGRRAGIWLAPFVATADSELARTHPDWLVGDAGANWGAPLRGLDLGRPDVRDWLRGVVARLADLGFDYFKLDFLYGGALTRTPEDPDGTRAYRAGLATVREGAGPEAYLVGCGAPILPSVGLVDAMRVSPDTFHPEGQDGSTGLRGEMGARARAWQQGRLWVNDADCLVARPSFPLREPWADVVREVSGLRSCSDRIAELDEWGLTTVRDLLGHTPPPTPFLTEGTHD
ncbi:MAG: alpha-galactosidase [Actinobacteria bacterium]|nr:alpha-galactosidase [Actinomycetota bacterium]